MILTRENRSSQKKACLIATSFATCFTWTGLGWNPGCFSVRSVTNHLRYGMAFEDSH